MTIDLEQSEDWCLDTGALALCGTDMREHTRRSEGVRWCFTCRVRHEFWWVVMTPVGLSYYGPSAHMEGVHPRCTDLFPGWYREAADE